MQVARSIHSSYNESHNEAIHEPNYFSLSDPNSHNRSNGFEEDPSLQRFQCIICQSPTLNCCAACKRIFYCSAEHQQLHWKTHQFECAKESVISERSHEDETSRLNLEASSGLKTGRETQRKSVNTIREDTVINQQGVTERKEYEKSKKFDTPTVKPSEKSEECSSSIATEAKELARIALAEERSQKLKEALQLYTKKQYQHAVIKAKRAYQISSADGTDIDQIISDGLLLVKCLLNSDEISNAREILVEVWRITKENFNDSKISAAGAKMSPGKLKLAMLKKETNSFVHDDTLSYSQKYQINQQVRKLSNLFSCIATLFYSIGDFNNCEAAYAKYVKVIENNFGKESLETSNVYFCVGAFYLENKYHIKAMACFQSSLNIRQNHFASNEHESIADCYYNIAVIYKQAQDNQKAMQVLNKVIKIRVSTIGEISLPVAQALELSAKIYFEVGDYREAFNKFQNCQIIRRKILREEKHTDILRINTLVKNLYNKVVQVIIETKTFTKQREIFLCKALKTQMEQAPLFAEVLPKVNIDPEPSQPLQFNSIPSKTSVVVSRPESSKYTESPTKLSIKIPPTKPENEKNSGSERNNFLQTQASTQDSTERNIRGLKERQFSNLSHKTGTFPTHDKVISKRGSIGGEYMETNNDNVLSLREDTESDNALESYRLISDLKNMANLRKTLPVPEKDRESSSRMDSLTAQDFYPFRKDGPISSFVLTSQEEIDVEH